MCSVQQVKGQSAVVDSSDRIPVPGLGSRVQDLESGVWSLESGIWGLGSGDRGLKNWNPKDDPPK